MTPNRTKEEDRMNPFWEQRDRTTFHLFPVLLAVFLGVPLGIPLAAASVRSGLSLWGLALPAGTRPVTVGRSEEGEESAHLPVSWAP